MSLIYLASPYTHQDKEIEELRYVRALAYVAKTLKEINYASVYSPVVHYHPLARKFELPGDYAFWMRHNSDIMCVASEIHVLTLPGWKDSKGVAGEVAYATDNGIRVKFVDPV